VQGSSIGTQWAIKRGFSLTNKKFSLGCKPHLQACSMDCIVAILLQRPLHTYFEPSPSVSLLYKSDLYAQIKCTTLCFNMPREVLDVSARPTANHLHATAGKMPVLKRIRPVVISKPVALDVGRPAGLEGRV
jgi:hypothetical protein